LGDLERTGDAANLAQCWTGMKRAFSGPTIMNSIDPVRDRAELVDDLFSRFADRPLRIRSDTSTLSPSFCCARLIGSVMAVFGGSKLSEKHRLRPLGV
jgi:hypothetical protein